MNEKKKAPGAAGTATEATEEMTADTGIPTADYSITYNSPVSRLLERGRENATSKELLMYLIRSSDERELRMRINAERKPLAEHRQLKEWITIDEAENNYGEKYRFQKKSFVVYHDIRKPLELLEDEQCGKLFRAILDYSEFGNVPAFDDAGLEMAFAFIRNSIDRDAESWEIKRKARAEAGAKGGQQTAANKANAAFAEQLEQSEANQAVPVPVPVPTPVPVNDIVINDIEVKPPTKRFSPPSIDEVVKYCAERNNGIDAHRFVDYYTAVGWKVGKNVMKDWRAAVRTWEQNSKGKTNIRDAGKYYDYAGEDSL